MKAFARAALTRARIVGVAVGNFQARLLVTLFYFTALPVFAVIYRRAAGRKKAAGGWSDSRGELTLEQARKQW